MYDTSRAALNGANLFFTPNLKTCRMAFTRELAASGNLRSRNTSMASFVIFDRGKSRKYFNDPGLIGSS
jgi:hypothetical protein